MTRHCQLVIGPAGSGKSTYCATIMSYCESSKRPIYLVNLDPAAEHFEYSPTIDICDLISVNDVMEELGLGPNGGLIYCMEFLLNNIDWLQDQIDQYEDDYLLFDCPGQIELYTHPIMRQLIEALKQWGFAVSAVYLLDSQFIIDPSKFFAGLLTATATMINLEVPHINVMSKWDLVQGKFSDEELEEYLNPEAINFLSKIQSTCNPRHAKLSEALVDLVELYGMINFIPFNIKDEDSVEYCLSVIDNAIQYGEDLEPKEPSGME